MLLYLKRTWFMLVRQRADYLKFPNLQPAQRGPTEFQMRYRSNVKSAAYSAVTSRAASRQGAAVVQWLQGRGRDPP